jgi:MFS family permease
VNNTGAPTSFLNKPFLLLCLAMFLAYANQWLMTPIIPLYVRDLGGSAFMAGLVLLAFSFPSFTCRPLVGRVADRLNAAMVLACGIGLLITGTLLFLVPLIAAAFAGAVLRGLGWAGINVGGYTALGNTTPPERRGEAAGYYTGALTSVTTLFPALALWIIEGYGGFQPVFLVAMGMAALALPVTYFLAKHLEKLRQPAPTAQESGSLIDRRVLLPTGLNLCSTLITPSVMAFLPLYAHSLDISNIGLFYVLAGITSVVVRPLLGRKSDQMGRGPAIALGLGAQLVGFVLIILAHALPLILVGGVFVAVGLAMVGSTTTALAMDLTDTRTRGRGMATFSLSFQIGNGLGAIFSGALADFIGLRGMYAGSIVITLVGFALLATAWKQLPQPGGR